MSCLPKPVLRGHIKRIGIKGLFGAIAFASFNCFLFEVLYRRPKAKRYEEFNKTYDSKAHTLDLINWGYFNTIRPEDIRKDED